MSAHPSQVLRVGLFGLLLSLTACGAPGEPIFGFGPPPGSGPAAWQTARFPWLAADGFVHVHFTRPGTEPNGGEDSEADDAVVRMLESAQSSIDLCLYEFNRRPIIDAALDAVARGVKVRFAGDGDESEDEGYEELKSAGVELALRRPRDRIMHNKFGVVDDTWVFTGSMNHSENGALRNNNNLIRIESPEVAALYSQEFQQMYDERLFGRKKDRDLGGAEVKVAGRELGIWFSPQDGLDEKLLEALASADHSVHFMIFSFTKTEIRDQLIALNKQGVEVIGIFDESQARGRYSVDESLAMNGVPTLIDGNHNARGFAGGKLHHKVMIIDAGTDSDPTVVTGSYNWSKNATRYNDENLVILRGADFVAPFVEEFCQALSHATPHPYASASTPAPCPRIGRNVRINELLADPEGPETDDEFVELVNASKHPVDISGWSLGDEVRADRHLFPSGTILEAGSFISIFGGEAELGSGRSVASSGRLGLNNPGDEISLRDADGVIMDRIRYRRAVTGISFNRSPDGALTGPFVLHDEASEAPHSPGLRTAEPVEIESPAPPLVHINELLPNPEGSDRGQEFVEIVNASKEPADISGWQLGDRLVATRHVFATGSVLQPGKAVTVFDRGEHSGVDSLVLSSSGSLSLNNSNETVVLRDASGAIIHEVTYLSTRNGVSLNCPDDGFATTDFVHHEEMEGASGGSSPGRKANGSDW